VSFQAPLLLGLLAVVPLAAAAYVLAQRRARKFAVRYTNVDLLASVAGRSWTRHVPAVLALLALAALLVALARPQATVAVPVEQASIVLATDVSGSMQSKDVAPTRMEAARAAARQFLAKVPKRIKVGVIAFNQAPTVLQAPTDDRAAARSALDRLEISGGTATGDALHQALGLVRKDGKSTQPPAAIVLLSDGASTKGRDAVAVARDAKRLNVPVFTISLGTPNGTIQVTDPNGATRTEKVPPDPATMATVAKVSGGQAYRTADAAKLAQVYAHLGSDLAKKKEPRELTSGFAGAALILVLVGSALSLRWFGRLT
jgi:Ca-activated chloride channel family protein